MSEPPSNPYDPNWPKPEHPYGQSQPSEPAGEPYGQSAPSPGAESPYAPYGQQAQNPYDPNPYAAPPPPYGQQPYGQTQHGQAQWGQPQPYGYAGAGVQPHPTATTSMVLGLVSLAGILFCAGITLVLSPFAWWLGGRAVKEIDASQGRLGGRESAQAGRIMGIIGTVLLLLGIAAFTALIAIGIAASESSSDDIVYERDGVYSYDSSM